MTSGQEMVLVYSFNLETAHGLCQTIYSICILAVKWDNKYWDNRHANAYFAQSFRSWAMYSYRVVMYCNKNMKTFTHTSDIIDTSLLLLTISLLQLSKQLLKI